jgi:signal transduction histidine kinase
VWWDAATYAALAIGGAAILVSDGGIQNRTVVVVAVGVIAVAYLLLGSRAARSRSQPVARAYLGVAVAGTAAAAAQGGLATFLLFVTFTHIWVLLERRWEAIAVATVQAAAATIAITLGEGDGEGLSGRVFASVAPEMTLALIFTVALGLWVARTMLQSQTNAVLLAELRAAQAQLAVTQHAAGVATERERIAREIHDTLAQGFMSVVTQAQVASSALDRGDADDVRERLVVMEATARDNLAEARALVAASAPAPLQGGSLADALRRLAARWAAETGLRAVVEADGVGPLAPGDEVVLLRAAQEALTNVRRHAGASAVRVSLAGGGSGPVRLEVADDAVGIPAGTPEGYGLRGMRDRVVSVGGALALMGRAGTVVAVSLPARGATAAGSGSGAGSGAGSGDRAGNRETR